MGRKSKLTEQQWQEIGRRLIANERPSDLAREFGVSPAVLSRRFAKRTATVKEVANQIVSADVALKSLPIAQQIEAMTLADELKAVSMHLAKAARFGSATAHRLAGIAHGKVQEIDDAAPLTEKSMESLRNVAVLTRMANEASNIGVNLLAANKDALKKAEEGADKAGLLKQLADSLPD